MTRKPKIIKWTINPEDMDNIVDTISLVDDPAIEINWLAFTKDKGIPKTSTDEFAALTLAAEYQKEKFAQREVPQERFQQFEGENIIVAPAMIADKLILRIDADGDPYYGFFDAQACKNACYAFQKYKLTDKFNIDHNANQIAEGVYLAETWLVASTELDKSQYFGYSLPEGSWMTILKFDNTELYDEYVASGLLKGLSVEAFVLEQVILAKTKPLKIK